ncbi:DUF262 domain-containing protein [Sporosarcina jeotgali]|uniref:DUF262 domain-containing protein n=1 Tax=Sporosarcina jeotgali TaxID=3020056 RepID=A0ABZ0KYC1_9BACL|nr:DUF262 domain-containing protein [Sporosarcina sp. B2O-1]WOV83899.1 DUF262 domain-containing protein [Sporosarcina sp. B2O-1]
MPLIEEELKIVKIQELLDKELTLPSYQRPYSWSVQSTNTLFLDTYGAFKEGTNEYRLGSVILHKEIKGGGAKYNIVDGQQRLTSLSILLYCLGDVTQSLLQEKYNKLSNDAIVMNYRILAKRTGELDKDELENYKEYLMNQCTTVQIVTDGEQEAFQFFDSQNSRGKELDPHDLLKSYHLREMVNDDEYVKMKIINRWEDLSQNDLRDLFRNYLYPVTQWYKRKEGLGYSSNKIDAFKGIKSSNIFNYAIYHKASNLFIEQFNSSGSNELLSSNELNQFQLTQPLIAGKRFFYYTLHYGDLLEKVQKVINQFHDETELPSKRSGDIYIKQLYKCVLLLFADRFGIDSLTKPVLQQFYSWSYSLRLSMNAVYPQTINKYARGNHHRINAGLDMFSKINEMMGPEELKLIVLERPEADEKSIEKYNKIYEKLCIWNRW